MPRWDAARLPLNLVAGLFDPVHSPRYAIVKNPMDCPRNAIGVGLFCTDCFYFVSARFLVAHVQDAEDNDDDDGKWRDVTE